MRTTFSRVWVAVGLLASVAIALPAPATAAAPTRIVDQTTQVVCTAVHAGVEITVGVGRSDLGGTESRVQVSDATGETIGGGEGTSDWGDGTFRAVIPVVGNDEQVLSEVYFSGRYAASGEPEQTLSRFNVGNVHVVEDHTETPASVSDVVIRYRDLTFTDPDCGAWLNDGSLIFTNPATAIQFGSSLPYDCTGSNLDLEQTSINGSVDALFVSVWFADRIEANAAGLVTAGGGAWQGQFDLQIADEPAGTVAATASLNRSGKPAHATEGATGMRNHFQVTPYRLAMSIAGPDAPATLNCTLYQVREKLHYLDRVE